jgi:hypothetical protein
MSAARDSGRAKHLLGWRGKKLSRQPDGGGLASRDESDVCDVMPSCAMAMTEATALN